MFTVDRATVDSERETGRDFEMLRCLLLPVRLVGDAESTVLALSVEDGLRESRGDALFRRRADLSDGLPPKEGEVALEDAGEAVESERRSSGNAVSIPVSRCEKREPMPGGHGHDGGS